MSAPRPPKSQRREDARTQALRLREEQARAARRQRTIVLSLLGVGLLVIVAVVVYIFASAQDDASPQGPLEEVRPEVSTDRGGIVVDADGVLAQPPAMEEGGEAGYVFADDAFEGEPVVVTVYADYMCPFCGLFEQTAGPTLDDLRESGEVVVAYHPVSILDRFSEGSGYSTRAASAAFHVAQEAPEAFTAFNALLFANQPAEGTEGLSDEQIAELATQAGAPQEVAADLADGTYRWWAAQATELATEDLGELATPTILIDGERLTGDWRQEGVLADAIEAARG